MQTTLETPLACYPPPHVLLLISLSGTPSAALCNPCLRFEQVLVTRMNESLRGLLDDISEDNWMYDPIDLGQGHQHWR